MYASACVRVSFFCVVFRTVFFFDRESGLFCKCVCVSVSYFVVVVLCFLFDRVASLSCRWDVE